MIQVEVNGIAVSVRPGSTVIQACEAVGIEIPRFCYHERLLVAGNCRMCLVEIAGSPKPQAACALPVMPNMKVMTDSPQVKKARESVMEFLLVNHPLDCPICDQGGECDRQDQSMIYGSDRSRMFEAKRGVEDKERGPLVKTVMTRCIHCTRCIRFASEIAGVGDRGTSGRGRETEVGTYISKARQTEVSGNLIDLCPVGALTSKPTAFMTRSWERDTVDTVDIADGVGSSIRAQSRGLERFRIQPRENDDVNQAWLGDKSRFRVDGLKHQRITDAYARTESLDPTKKDGALQKVTVETALQRATERLSSSPRVDVCVNSSMSLEHRTSASRLVRRLEKQGKEVTVHARGSGSHRSLDIGSMVETSERGSINAISQADVVVLVGFNPRREAPVRNLRLRESFLRDQTQVVTRGLGLTSGEVTHGLTFPTINRGRTVGTLDARRKGNHESSSIRFEAKRPRIRVGPSVFGRHDAAPRRQGRRQLSKALSKDNKRGKVMHRMSDTANRTSVHARGFNGVGKRQSSSALIRRGVGLADFVESGIPLPTVSDHSSMISMVSHGDLLIGCSDVIVPISSPYEEEGHYANLEGRVQRHRASVSSAASRGSRRQSTSLPWLPLDHRAGDSQSAVAKALADTLRQVRQGSSVSRRGKLGSSSASMQSITGGVTSKVVPSLHDYYREGHVLARVSPTMAKCSQTSKAHESF